MSVQMSKFLLLILLGIEVWDLTAQMQYMIFFRKLLSCFLDPFTSTSLLYSHSSSFLFGVIFCQDIQLRIYSQGKAKSKTRWYWCPLPTPFQICTESGKRKIEDSQICDQLPNLNKLYPEVHNFHTSNSYWKYFSASYSVQRGVKAAQETRLEGEGDTWVIRRLCSLKPSPTVLSSHSLLTETVFSCIAEMPTTK